MIHVCICDDNPILIEKEFEQVKLLTSKHNIDVKISTFPSGEALLFYAEDHFNDIDIIFLDIIMGETNGIETANKLRSLGCEAQIIFITSSKEHVFSSFDSNPLHYLIKDGNEFKRMESVFLKAVELIRKNNKMFVFKKGATTKRIPFVKIKYFEILGRVMTIHYEDTVLEYYKKIDELELELEAYNFCRVHRSYIVNLYFISELNRNEITLSNGDVLPVSRSYYPIIKKKLSNYLRNGD